MPWLRPHTPIKNLDSGRFGPRLVRCKTRAFPVAGPSKMGSRTPFHGIPPNQKSTSEHIGRFQLDLWIQGYRRFLCMNLAMAESE